MMHMDTAPEASWVRAFHPMSTLLFDLYHYLEQNGAFGLVPDHIPGLRSHILPGCRVRHPLSSKKIFVRYVLDPHMTFIESRTVC